MANPHYINLSFPERQLPTGKHKLSIIFTVELEGTNSTIYAEDELIYLLKIGEYELDIDLDNQLMNPATMKFEILDAYRHLWDYLYNDDFGSIAKNPIVMLELDRGTGYQIEFEGNIVESDTIYDEVTNVLSIRAATIQGTLYDVKLFDLDTTTGEYTWLDPLSLLEQDSVYIVDLIESIYKYMDATIGVEISQDWTFRGQQWANSENPPDWEEYISSDLPFTAIFVKPQMFFRSPDYPSLGDVLKQLAWDFGCFTGMLTNKKAYFKKLYPAMPGIYIVLEEDAIIAKERSQREYYQGVNLAITTNYENVVSSEYFLGRKTNVRGAYLEAKSSYFFRDINPIDDPNRSESNYYLHDGEVFPADYHLYLICLNENTYGADLTFWDKDPTQPYSGAWFDSPIFQVARYYYKHRCLPQYTNIMRFEVAGNDYSILTDILHEGQYFHVVYLSKNYHQNTTTIEALRIN